MSPSKEIRKGLSEGRRGGHLLWARAATRRVRRSLPGTEEKPEHRGRAKDEARNPGSLGTTGAQHGWCAMKGSEPLMPPNSRRLVLSRKEDRACQAGGVTPDMC